jgi:hypothetical protein
VQHIAARSLVVEKNGDDRLFVRNTAPVALSDVFVTTGTPRTPAFKLIGLSLEPGEAKEVTAPAERQEQLASARKITGVAFTPTFEKAPGG